MRIKKMKLHPMVKYLQDLQDSLQCHYSEKIKKKQNGYDDRGVWISVRCVCGASYLTPYYLRDSGKCKECGKLFFRGKK